MKKTAALLLALCLFLLPLPFGAAGANDAPANEGATVTVSTPEELSALRDDLSAHAVLLCDLRVDDPDWTPIGDVDRPFSGVFDGNGHTVTLKIDCRKSGSGALVGLFGCVSGSVKRLRLGGRIKATVDSACIGPAAAVLTAGGYIFNCDSSVEIDATCRAPSAVGGLAGAVYFSGAAYDGSVRACLNSGAVTVSAGSSAASDGPLSVGTNGSAGGILGFVADGARAEVNKCVNTGALNVKSGKYNVGGIVGQTCVNSSTTGIDIVQCANKGDVTVTRIEGERAAGVIGYIKSGKIAYCYNTGSVKAFSDNGKTVSRVGYGTHYGIFGYANLGAGNTLEVLYCYNASPEPAEAEIGVVRNPSYGVFKNFYMSGREEYERELNAANVGSGNPGTPFDDAASLTALLEKEAPGTYLAVHDMDGNALWPCLAFESWRRAEINDGVSFFGTVREGEGTFDLRLIVHAKKEYAGGTLNVKFELPGGGQRLESFVLWKDMTVKNRIYADDCRYRPAEGCYFYTTVFSGLPVGYFRTISLEFTNGGELLKTGSVPYGAFLKESSSQEPGLEGLPTYPDGTASAVYNAGPGLENDKNGTTDSDCKEIVISGTTAASFASYIATLKEDGFETLFERSVDGNAFRLMKKNGKLFYLYFTSAVREARIVCDAASTAPVTALAGGQGDLEVLLYQYALDYTKGTGQTSGKDFYEIDCGMFYVLRLADGSLFLIDSGHKRQSSDAALEAVNDFLHEITNTPAGGKVRVAGWFFTHAHGDHVYLAHAFLEKYRDQYDLEAVFCNFPSYHTLTSGYDGGTFLLKDTVNKYYPSCACYKLHTGQTFALPGVSFEVLYTHEDAVQAVTGKTMISDFNDTSTVLRATVNGKTVSFLGDTSGVGQSLLLKNNKKSALKSDVVQLAHHCFNNLSDLYRQIAAPLILCPNSEENADKNANVRRAAVNAAGKDFSGILYEGEYTYVVSFSGEKPEYAAAKSIYTDGFYFTKPAELDRFTGDEQAERPLDASALEGLTDLSALIVAKSGDGTPGTKADEAPQTLFDGDVGTKWCETVSSSPYVAFRTKTPVKVAAYALYSGNDTSAFPGRNPKSWTLWGSEDGVDFTAFDAVYDGGMNAADRSASVYAAESAGGAYSYFVLCIHKTADGGPTMQLSELKLYGTAEE